VLPVAQLRLDVVLLADGQRELEPVREALDLLPRVPLPPDLLPLLEDVLRGGRRLDEDVARRLLHGRPVLGPCYVLLSGVLPDAHLDELRRISQGASPWMKPGRVRPRMSR